MQATVKVRGQSREGSLARRGSGTGVKPTLRGAATVSVANMRGTRLNELLGSGLVLTNRTHNFVGLAA